MKMSIAVALFGFMAATSAFAQSSTQPEASPTTNMISFACIRQNRTSKLRADHRCDFQSAQPFRAAHQWMFAAADAFEKRIDFVG